MARPVLQLNTTTGLFEVTPQMIEASEVDTTPTAAGIPRADGTGKIAGGWLPDSVRTVNVEETDGVPALTDIATLVFDAGTVAFLGGGKARITGGGGDTINLQGRPVAANAPDYGQALVWTGSAWAPATVSGGSGSDWLTAVQLVGLVDGVNRTFDLPAPAIPSSLTVYVDDVSLTEAAFTMSTYQNQVIGVTPTNANGFNSGGFYGSSPVACLVDGLTTGAFWSSGGTIPVVSWQLLAPKAISRTNVYSSTAGGFGGLSTYQIDYSDDGISWMSAITGASANMVVSLPAQDPHIWWRLVGQSKGYYEWSIIEIQLETLMVTVETVIYDTAPAVGTVPRASFRIAPTVVTGGGTTSTGSGPGGTIFLFDRYW